MNNNNHQDKYQTLSLYDKLGYALGIAYETHRDQTRKDGSWYIFHPLRMMIDIGKIMINAGEQEVNLMIIALLHDVLEDTRDKYKRQLLREDLIKKLGINLVKQLDLLTHNGDKDSYKEYINKIVNSQDVDVITIKVLDLYDNLKTIDSLHPHVKERLKNRYEDAIHTLKKAGMNLTTKELASFMGKHIPDDIIKEVANSLVKSVNESMNKMADVGNNTFKDTKKEYKNEDTCDCHRCTAARHNREMKHH